MIRTLPVLIAVLLLPSIAKSVEQAPHPLDKARTLAKSGQYAEAIIEFNKVRDTQPEVITPLDGDQFGAVYAHARDWAGVQQHAAWMFKKFPLPQRIENAERTAKGYLTYPNSDNKELSAHGLTLTTFAAENAKGQWVNWFYTAHGLALYRNGKYKDSIRWTEKTNLDKDPKLTSFAQAIEAMSQHALGNQEAAKELLKRAQSDFQKLPDPGTPEFAESWSDILTSKSVIEEAERLLD